MKKARHPTIPLGRAVVWIFLSVLMVSGLAWMGWLYYLHLKELRYQDKQYAITAIVQTTSQSEGLNTGYFAELLGLSVDRPSNLYQFDTKEGTQTLLACPLIKKAVIKKILPQTLYIDYLMRTPAAYVGDYTNTALDREGILFPFNPFYTPKRIPILFLGLQDVEKGWGDSLEGHEGLKLAFEMMDFMRTIKGLETVALKKIDVSQAFAESYGQRQIILLVEESLDIIKEGKPAIVLKPVFLRLNVDEYQKCLMSYSHLRSYLRTQVEESIDTNKQTLEPAIVDLRIRQLAFLKNL